MANTIRLKRASGSDPGASDLVTGELAVRTDSGKLFTKKDDNSIAEIGGDATVADGSITNAKIASDAAIAVSKLTGVFPLAGGTLTGDSTIASGITNKNIDIDINGTNTLIRFDDDLKATFGDSDDLQIFHDGSDSIINDNGTGTLQLQLGGSTKFEIQSGGVGVTGNIVVSGNVDGRDLATDGTKLDGIESGATADQTKSDIDALGIAASTAATLATARTIAGVSFDGSANISLNNNAITNGAGYITATLTQEQVEDYVGGMLTGNTETGITVTYQDSDGTIDFVVGTLNQDTTGNAATATALETARTIGGTSFDGTANITPAECTNADTVDSLHATSFLRSDAADTATGLLSLNGGIAIQGKCSGNVTSVTQSSGNITFDFSASTHHKVTLTQNATFLEPSNQTVGQSGSIFIKQPSSGSYTGSFHSSFKFQGGTQPTLSTGSGMVDRVDYVIYESSKIHAVVTLDYQ